MTDHLVFFLCRGQESAGIVMSEGGGNSFRIHKGNGLVSNVFTSDILSQLPGNLGIGHTRYSTVGGIDSTNTQPFVVHTADGPLAVAHNGEIVNVEPLRKMVYAKGVGLSSLSDSELITQILCLVPPNGSGTALCMDWPSRITHLMHLTPLSYSLLILHGNSIYGVRDLFGNRPLCLGRIHHPFDIHGGEGNKGVSHPQTNTERTLGWVISSESCAFQCMGAEFMREVEPGELVEISSSGIRSLCVVQLPHPKSTALCIFEYVYFSRPDTFLEGQQVWKVRERCGKELAIEAPVEADIVSTVPESATPAALGFAQHLGIPYTEVFSKNRYVGRTFIQPTTQSRRLGVTKKFGALRENLEGRRVVIVDDSIVRGTTIGPIIKMLKQAGAREVCPYLLLPLIDLLDVELVLNVLKTGAASLVYLSIEGLEKAVKEGINDTQGRERQGHCTACLT
ncbi:unnamed protein product, partial [Darwinula stevensoni]